MPRAVSLPARALLGTLLAVTWSAPTWSLTRIACVGDSITAGYGLAANEAYPVVLQGLFDAANYEVANFGLSGATLMKSGNKPYWSSAEYDASGEFEPNIVVLMLGTNDGKAANWVSEAEFDADYIELVAHYRDLGAEVFIGVPPPVFEPGAFEIVPQLVNEEVGAHVRQLAIELDAPLIDVFAEFESQPELFPDKVHPNAEGARQLAQIIFEALQQHSEPAASSSAAQNGHDAGTGGSASGGAPDLGQGAEASVGSSAGAAAGSTSSATSDDSSAPSGEGGAASQPTAQGTGGSTEPTSSGAASHGAGGESVGPEPTDSAPTPVPTPGASPPATNGAPTSGTPAGGSPPASSASATTPGAAPANSMSKVNEQASDSGCDYGRSGSHRTNGCVDYGVLLLFAAVLRRCARAKATKPSPANSAARSHRAPAV